MHRALVMREVVGRVPDLLRDMGRDLGRQLRALMENELPGWSFDVMYYPQNLRVERVLPMRPTEIPDDQDDGPWLCHWDWDANHVRPEELRLLYRDTRRRRTIVRIPYELLMTPDTMRQASRALVKQLFKPHVRPTARHRRLVLVCLRLYACWYQCFHQSPRVLPTSSDVTQHQQQQQQQQQEEANAD